MNSNNEEDFNMHFDYLEEFGNGFNYISDLGMKSLLELLHYIKNKRNKYKAPVQKAIARKAINEELKNASEVDIMRYILNKPIEIVTAINRFSTPTFKRKYNIVLKRRLKL